MSKLRAVKIIILVVLFLGIYYAVVYFYDALSLDIDLITEDFNQVKYILGITSASAITWLTSKASRQIYFSLRQLLIKLSLPDFVIGIISIIIGLVLGALASVPLSGIPQPWSWILSLAVVVLTTVAAIWAFNLKKQTIIEWFSTLRFLQRSQEQQDRESRPSRISTVQAEIINPMVLDTSAIIDHRIGEIVKNGFLYGTILLPTFILEELQQVADSSNSEKRQRGRLGLKLLQQIKRSKKLPTVTIEETYPEIELVDSKLIQLAIDFKAKIITCDYNLNSVAKVRGVSILNINELALNLQPQYLPGEVINIKVVQAGKEDGQGLGYLADGTLVIVQDGKPYIGKEIKVEIHRNFQNTAGRMIFVKALTERKKSKLR